MVKRPVSNNIKCPFCGTTFYRSDLSYVDSRVYLKRMKNRLEIYPLGKNVAASPKLKQQHPELLRLEMSACPNCHRITVRAVGIGDQYKHHHVFNIYPRFNADPLPTYVPDQIRQDYKEANEVYEVSPNSAAMLARRILEEIIADFYHIEEGDLYHDLDQLRHKQSNPRVWQAIDSIRRLGNIGAHQTQNVDNVFGNVSVKGAKEIIGLIRMVIHDTYVEDHLSRHLEKSVIRSAKKLNYQPHYYPSDENSQSSRRNYRSRNTHKSYSSHNSNNANRSKSSNASRGHQQHRNNHRRNQNNSRRENNRRSNQKRNIRRNSSTPKRNNYRKQSRPSNNRKSNQRNSNSYRKTHRNNNYRRSTRSRERNQQSRSRHTQRRSTRHSKKSRVRDKSFTIIQGK
ncbi:DUF4145 domain-containing protein [Acetilactobacillus jinshanensis]|uniref:DUF4145 domain-containing protein n=1 Tax=Acetilactobacillus jinshanensis TaxID=1720083 RepID=A0A4P6ZJS8_9LACO|nr:DUF4145 domain-containing protein [Acetilactobacillus jinshanensis]QBP17737.1 DUF4145 domain-containing protein [Acetilactobacillus jinshanensis]URL60599.1 DUF4145 domain-containing protein [uncultured bacterium]